MSRATWAAFISTAIVLVLAVAFLAHTSPDSAQSRAFTELLTERHALDQALKLHALEARFQFVASYDQLANDDLGLQRLERESLAMIPDFLNDSERRDLATGLERYATLAAERATLLERFKSKNALLRNSVTYFPSLASDILERTNDAELSARVNDVRAQTLLLALGGSAQTGRAHARSMQQLLEAAKAGSSDPDQQALRLMLAHARTVASEKAQTDDLLARVLRVPIDEARTDVSERYQRYIARANRRAAIFGYCVSALALILLGILAHAGFRLRRAASALQSVNDRLESAVLERTAQLEEAMNKRARVEIELRQAQKLEGIGQLAAGIAHEINTPIQYVGDSVHFLKTAFTDVEKVLEEYRAASNSLAEEASEHSAFATARTMAEEIDLDGLRKEIPDAFELISDGTKQVTSIVSAMKTFAHTSFEKTPEDLNAAIEVTLVVAKNEYKYVADLHKELSPLPEVTCDAGRIRQVLLNLIVNAAHAIGDRVGSGGDKGTITVRSEQRGEDVVISVSDTGTGIPEAVRERIFDPFFTTKPPGKGSGQGLAIAQSIVDQHGGKLWFSTELGQGTTFFIQLPVQAKDRRGPSDIDYEASAAE